MTTKKIIDNGDGTYTETLTLTGSFTEPGVSESFFPRAGRNFNIWFEAGGDGIVQLEKRTVGGSWSIIIDRDARFGAWSYFLNLQNAFVTQWREDEVGVEYRLNCSALNAGPITYRLSQ